jgi:RNA polymerase sigma factor (sigma-70 family)
MGEEHSARGSAVLPILVRGSSRRARVSQAFAAERKADFRRADHELVHERIRLPRDSAGSTPQEGCHSFGCGDQYVVMQSWSTLSDEGLLRAAAADRGAFGVFYERHERALLGFLGAATRRADLAADLTAETFAAALESCANFDPGRGTARLWLFGIAGNVLAGSARRGRVESEARRRLGFEAIVLEGAELDAIDRLIELEGDALVEELLAELPADQADLLRSRIVKERGYAEIAAELDCSEAVVRKRVSRALGRLRRQLGQELA